MKYTLPTILSVTLLTGGLLLASPAMADQHGMHGKGHGMHQAQHDWKATLTEAQEKQLGKLKLDFKKKVLPLKARIKQAKIELALLVTADKPNQDSINKKIDELLKLKGEKMRLKASHRIEVRKILTEEQRVKFDLHVLKKAYHGKKGHHSGHH